jgi:hypothetical protein
MRFDIMSAGRAIDGAKIETAALADIAVDLLDALRHP